MNMNKLLRSRHLILIGGLLVYYFLVLYPFSSSYHNPVKGGLSDAFHLPMFLGVTLFLYILTPRTKHSSRLIISMVLAVAIAGYTELIQPQTGRSASWTDLFNGILGVLLAGYGLQYFHREAKKQLYYLYGIAVAAAAVYVLIPAIQSYSAQKHQREIFPILATFDSTQELDNWRFYSLGSKTPSKAQLRSKTPFSSNNGLYLEANEANYVGFEFYPVVHDFSKYDRLKFEIFNPGPEFLLRLRIDDKKYSAYDDRTNLSLPIKPGLNPIVISLNDIKSGPKTRPLNLATIHTIFFFVAKESTPSRFYLDNLMLEK